MNLDLDAIKTAFAANDMPAIIKLASGKDSDIWAAAMTAHYGPCGIHSSWLDAEGCPGAEILARCPEIGSRMTEAKERIPGLVRWIERYAELKQQERARLIAMHGPAE